MNATPSTRRDFLQSAAWAVAGAALAARVQAADPVPADAASQHPQPPRSTKTPLTARLVRHGGVLKIEINGTVFEPLAYRSYRPTPELIRGFAGTGLKLANVTHTGMLCTLDVPYSLFGEVWTGPEQFDWKAFDAQMALFEANAPGAYYNLALQIDTRDWYLAAHPDCSNSYWNLVETAGHEPWRADTAASLQEFLRQIEARYGDRVFAYSLLCGSSTEWYTNSQGRGRPEAQIREHPIKTAAFRNFTGDPTATMPPLDVLQHTSHGVFRDPVADAAALRYWRFHHEIIGDAIVYFCRKAQEVLQHRKLLGLFYGYLTQLNSERLLQEGHLDYERVWSCPDIDMIYAPAKYGTPRSFEGASGYLLTVDCFSFAPSYPVARYVLRMWSISCPPNSDRGAPCHDGQFDEAGWTHCSRCGKTIRTSRLAATATATSVPIFALRGSMCPIISSRMASSATTAAPVVPVRSPGRDEGRRRLKLNRESSPIRGGASGKGRACLPFRACSPLDFPFRRTQP